MPVIEISSLTHPGVEIFSTLTEAQLRNRLEPDKGLFIAESPKVIKVALDAGYEPLAFLCEHKHIYGDAAEIIERCGDIPVYTSGRELLAELTGYVLTRGVLCAMRRPVPKSMEDVCRGARRIVVIDGVVDTTNIGAIFRSAAALGMDAVLLTRNSCDPLNRRAVRVSMGTVFLVPWLSQTAEISAIYSLWIIRWLYATLFIRFILIQMQWQAEPENILKIIGQTFIICRALRKTVSCRNFRRKRWI